MSYRKVLHTANLVNTDRSLVLRQKFAQKMLPILASQRRVINIDESSVPCLDFRHHKWAPRSEKNSMAHKDLAPKVNMIVAIDTTGKVYATLTQINTDSEVMISFLSRLSTVLTQEEEQRIIEVFNFKKAEEDFSVVVSYDDIAAKNYSLSAGQYFEVKIEYVDITPEQFAEKMQGFTTNLDSLFAQSRNLETEIKQQLAGLKHA